MQQPAVLHLQAERAEVARLHPWLAAAAADRRLPGDMLYGIEVALEEVVMNAILHGGIGGGDALITVALLAAPGAVEVRVEDPGRAFDPAGAPMPEVPRQLPGVVPGGAGLRLLRHFCPDISYERRDARNLLTLRFPLPPG
jgi:anti-sigma regulatory factor (Ser/Thr protein kinase)